MDNLPKYIYRYKTICSHNLIALKDNSINGTVFYRFKDQDELFMKLPDEFCAKHKVDFINKIKYFNVLYDDFNNNYYLACFSKNKPEEQNECWRLFANNGCGYCLVYDTEDLQKEINNSCDIIACLHNVRYYDSPYDISPFLKPFFTMVRNETNLAKKQRNISILENVVSNDPKLGKKIIELFCHKQKHYKPENEVRIICKKPNKNDGDFINSIIKVKPVEIVLTSSLDETNKKIIMDIANEQNIKIRIIDDPCKIKNEGF